MSVRFLTSPNHFCPVRPPDVFVPSQFKILHKVGFSFGTSTRARLIVSIRAIANLPEFGEELEDQPTKKQ